MIETQQQDIGKAMQDAVLQAALDTVDSSSKPALKKNPKSNLPGPGPGRPKGLQNKVTRTIREAVEAASQPGACHADGLAGWLIERAHGGIQDRQIFAQMVSKAMPLQVHANVEGGIQVQLSWLGSRQIGTTQTQPADVVTQVIDLQRDSGGKYRIADQNASDTPSADAEQKGAGDAQGA